MSLRPMLLLTVLATPAYADDALSALRACRSLTVDAERLACFDAQVPPVPVLLQLLQSELSVDGASSAPPVPEGDKAGAVAANPEPLAPPSSSSPLSRQWDLDEDNKLGTFVLRAHQPTYILPAWYLFSPNNRPSSPSQNPVSLFGTKLSNVETKYQISFKSKLWQNVMGTPADLWFGYTQQRIRYRAAGTAFMRWPGSKKAT